MVADLFTSKIHVCWSLFGERKFVTKLAQVCLAMETIVLPESVGELCVHWFGLSKAD